MRWLPCLGYRASAFNIRDRPVASGGIVVKGVKGGRCPYADWQHLAVKFLPLSAFESIQARLSVHGQG